ncbi:MAG: hypothetical protein LC723_03660, partial [Actinobacteria bacterium]|nr:hypothetical protein [Actinomycetota bacterium]
MSSILQRPRLRVPRLFAPGSSNSELVLGLVIAMSIGVVAAKQASIARVFVGIFGGLIFFLISMNGRITALRLAIIFLVFMGLIRRLLIPFAGWSEQDPLLLVGPGCAFMIWLNGKANIPKKRDALTLMAIFFFIWTFAQIVNPAQGSLASGLFGAIFWLPPLLWFFVGRTFPESIHRKIAGLIVICAVPAALHGLYQTFFGLLPFELHWLGVSNIGASVFYEGFKIRSFGPLTSPQEYGDFLVVAIAILYGTILARHRIMWLRLSLLFFLLFALFMQGSRSTFALAFLMLALTSIFWVRNLGAKILITFGVAALVFIFSLLPAPKDAGTTGASAAVNHQLSGLLNPGGSTTGLHADMISRGFAKAWNHPLGLGTSPVTILSVKQG